MKFMTESHVRESMKSTVSMSRACEIAGVSAEGFKEILASWGVTRIVKAPSMKKIKKEVKLILQE